MAEGRERKKKKSKERKLITKGEEGKEKGEGE